MINTKARKEITRKMNSGTCTPVISLPCARYLATFSAMIYTMVKMTAERKAAIFFITGKSRGLTRTE
jgi:hypothetical protein